MLARQESIRNAVEFLKKRPGFAGAQAQAMRRGKEWQDGLSEQEKLLASLQRLQAVIRLIDIRTEPYLALVDDMASQEAFMAMVNGIMDQAWQEYVGFSVYQAPPMREDPNYKSITDRGRHWVSEGYQRVDAKEKEVDQQPAKTPTETPENPTVFISYSWDDDEHKTWVLGLANRLRDQGIDAIIDRTHLELGGDTPEFMERSIRESRYVLVVCTEVYKARFDGRKGGAGYEGHIITAQMVKTVGLKKFIPLLRRGSWGSALPTALEGIFGADLSNDSEDEYRRLITHLHGTNPVRPVGPPPEWLQKPAGGDKTVVPTEARASGPEFLPPNDLTLVSQRRNSSLDIWLENHTLDPMEGCRFTLINLQRFSSARKDFQRNPFTPAPMIKMQTIIAGGWTDEAIPLAGFQQTTKRTLLIFRTFAYDSPSILMTEILIEGGGRNRTETKFISWTPGQDPEFIDDPRAVKPDAPASPFTTPPEYMEERKQLPDSALLKRIWARPRWCMEPA